MDWTSDADSLLLPSSFRILRMRICGIMNIVNCLFFEDRNRASVSTFPRYTIASSNYRMISRQSVYLLRSAARSFIPAFQNVNKLHKGA